MGFKIEKRPIHFPYPLSYSFQVEINARKIRFAKKNLFRLRFFYKNTSKTFTSWLRV
jgi:hypothetical protein